MKPAPPLDRQYHFKHYLITYAQWRYHGEMGGTGLPTFVQFPLDMSAKPGNGFMI